jgi:hypothetical protein
MAMFLDRASAHGRAWHRCGTCGQNYTGATAMALAEAWFSSVAMRDELDPWRLEAAHTLSDSLLRCGRYAEAERMCLEVMEREFGGDHPMTALAQGSVAECQKKKTKKKKMHPWNGERGWAPNLKR